jgi:cytochrome c oxidase assembly protein subunit 15
VYTLGLLDVVLLAPLWVQVTHLLAADTLWAALVVLTARLTLQPKEQGTGNREQERIGRGLKEVS